jgi:hypothetical protein
VRQSKLDNFALLDSMPSGTKSKRQLTKSASFKNKVIITSGFNGTGKTLVAQLVASFDRAELMNYAYELEWATAFLYTKDLSQTAHEQFVKMFVDNAIADLMMGRRVNTKLTDLSSLFNHGRKLEYLRRIFRKNTPDISQTIKEKRPILTLTGCHYFYVLPTLSRSLGERLLFIEVVRDPITIFPQLLILNKKRLKSSGRETDFLLRVKDDIEVPWPEYYCQQPALSGDTMVDLVGSVVRSIERVFEYYFQFRFEQLRVLNSSFMLIPFEQFVLQPDLWLAELIDLSGSKWSKGLKKEMTRQRVPRKFLSQGRDLPIYRSYDGNVGTLSVTSLEEEKSLNRRKVECLIDDKKLYRKLEVLSDRYSEWVTELPRPFCIKAG